MGLEVAVVDKRVLFNEVTKEPVPGCCPDAQIDYINTHPGKYIAKDVVELTMDGCSCQKRN